MKAFDACADAIKFSRVNATSLLMPVLPLVPTTIAIFFGATTDEISPKPKAGPVPTRAAVICAANCVISLAGLACIRFRCDDMSIAAVGYRLHRVN